MYVLSSWWRLLLSSWIICSLWAPAHFYIQKTYSAPGVRKNALLCIRVGRFVWIWYGSSSQELIVLIQLVVWIYSSTNILPKTDVSFSVEVFEVEVMFQERPEVVISPCIIVCKLTWNHNNPQNNHYFHSKSYCQSKNNVQCFAGCFNQAIIEVAFS